MLNWTLGYSSSADLDPDEIIELSPLQDDPQVPGEAQLMWFKAGKLPDYNYGSNVLEYAKYEDVFWHYRTLIDVRKKPGFEPAVTFNYLDYRYTIKANGRILADGEGMFTPVSLSLSEFEGQPVALECIIHPVPKVEGLPPTRSQARESAKPPVSYGWDWHPRLVTAGISGKVSFDYLPVTRLGECSYTYDLNDTLSSAEIAAEAEFISSDPAETVLLSVSLLDADGTVAAECSCPAAAGRNRLKLTLDSPKLWWPARQGDQNLYTLKFELITDAGTIGERSFSTGFRRVKLVMNEGGWNAASPATQGTYPFTLEINGRKIFCKGSNFVSADIFYSKIGIDSYRSLVGLALEANMNIFRMWGGSPVNKPEFFELCDKLGMMVWQEFPLSCNNYPDKPAYLSLLEKEASSIVKDLRLHPSVVMWCGGNELFNGWSGMTNQSLALRVLDRVTLTLDKNTPYIMTSPLYGVGHGPYVNIVDDRTGKEAIELFRESPRTAYTEFGCPGPASLDYIRQYMDEKDVQELFEVSRPATDDKAGIGLRDQTDTSKSPWRIHHAVKAHYPYDTWFRLNEIYRYFYKTSSVSECCELGQVIQGACYKVMFEQARRLWPKTSMAVNWCWNEPWPCFANNSLVSYPNVLHLAYFDVRQALRDQMLSAELPKLRHRIGDELKVALWAFNDLPDELKGSAFTVLLDLDDEDETRIELFRGSFEKSPALSSTQIGEFTFKIPENVTKTFNLIIKCENDELSSSYTLFRIDE